MIRALAVCAIWASLFVILICGMKEMGTSDETYPPLSKEELQQEKITKDSIEVHNEITELIMFGFPDDPPPKVYNTKKDGVIVVVSELPDSSIRKLDALMEMRFHKRYAGRFKIGSPYEYMKVLPLNE